MDEQLEFVKLIATRLDSAGIPYMLTGSVALSVYTIPRMTRDIDLVIECKHEDVDTIVQLFESDCYLERDSLQEAIVRKSLFNIIHNDWVVKADFIVRKDGQYRELEFERRQKIDIEGVPVYVVSPEDLILSKLFWAKDTNSELQLKDVRTIIESVSDMDWSYLEKWAMTLAVSEMLDQVKDK